MTHRLQLEVFDIPGPPAGTGADWRGQSQFGAAEEARLESFEKGYAAGWDDAVAARDSEATRLRADVGRNLQQLSFTYHEARGHVLRAMEPLLADMVAKVLPKLAQRALGATVVEALKPLVEDLSAAPVVIHLNAASRPAVEEMLEGLAAPPFRIVEEPALSPGQVHLQLGETGRRIDLDGVIAAIDSAISDFFRGGKEDPANG